MRPSDDEFAYRDGHLRFHPTAGQRQSTPSHNNGYYTSRDAYSPAASQIDGDYKYGRFDASALHIAHALKQTEVQKAYNKRREKPIDYYLVCVCVCDRCRAPGADVCVCFSVCLFGAQTRSE